MVGKFTEKEGKDDEEERSQGRLSLYIFECTKSILNISGDDYMEEIPVPIPNTEVKLSGAENTWLVTAREDREMPTQSIHPNGCFAIYSSIAQSVVRVYTNILDIIT